MLTAKPIVKNKFWIVEKDGRQYATIQSSPAGVAFVQDGEREQFTSIRGLNEKYKIAFGKKHKAAEATRQSVYGFPCDCLPHNTLFNVQKKVPVYTKEADSKSFFCAGHYLIDYGTNSFSYEYCPKLITVNRYKFCGPFHTKAATLAFLKSQKSAQ
jgi:hypothetical protein